MLTIGEVQRVGEQYDKKLIELYNRLPQASYGKKVRNFEALLMREFQLKLALFGFGAALIIFATWFSSYVVFSPIILSGDEWSFGPREVAHLLGFMGCVLAVWFYGNSFATRSTLFVSLLMGVLGMGMVVLYRYAPREIKDLIGSHAAKTFIELLYYYCVVCLSGCLLRKKTHWPFQPRRVLIITALILMLISFGWEVCTQPFEHAYRKAPRGYVQFAQVLCDFVGIAIGFVVVSGIIRRFEAHRSTKASTTDCVSSLAFAKELWVLSIMTAKRLRHLLPFGTALWTKARIRVRSPKG
ncbi:hypothetical protein [Pseudomonas azerbaijanoccidentalis]